MIDFSIGGVLVITKPAGYDCFHGFVNKNGEIIIPIKYENASSFEDYITYAVFNGKIVGFVIVGLNMVKKKNLRELVSYKELAKF